MMAEWSPEAGWRQALKLQQKHLRAGEREKHSTERDIETLRRRVERIWAAGRPEWRARGRPGRLP
jgi:hypothetical protein